MKKVSFFVGKLVRNVGIVFVKNRFFALGQLGFWGSAAYMYSGSFVGSFLYFVFLVNFLYVAIGVEFLFKSK
ncbi:hypothetical protein [Halomonas llamarensis]|uniref:Uncharacterized protein n=1 Tax=Halomonas llamarensis TaxID=2945104 RepID=A0ABT0SSS2_9GAMM|nr:hypothetical protein [Halomonas llamarensis]MCL7930880.1 hypothetical protein [Halomonas llamarensis]